MSRAIELMMKRLIPTGGVISPTSTTISTRMPNQIATCSGDMPKSIAEMTGKKIGTVSRIIDRLSITQPKTR